MFCVTPGIFSPVPASRRCLPAPDRLLPWPQRRQQPRTPVITYAAPSRVLRTETGPLPGPKRMRKWAPMRAFRARGAEPTRTPGPMSLRRTNLAVMVGFDSSSLCTKRVGPPNVRPGPADGDQLVGGVGQTRVRRPARADVVQEPLSAPGLGDAGNGPDRRGGHAKSPSEAEARGQSGFRADSPNFPKAARGVALAVPVLHGLRLWPGAGRRQQKK